MTKVLRKSYGPLSAGTKLSENNEATYPNGEVYTIEPYYVTTLRPRSTVWNTNNRRARRARLMKDMAILEAVKESNVADTV